MKPVRLHPRVYDDIDEALAYTREQFGPRQVVLYARLISKGRQTLRRHPTIGQLREDRVGARMSGPSSTTYIAIRLILVRSRPPEWRSCRGSGGFC